MKEKFSRMPVYMKQKIMLLGYYINVIYEALIAEKDYTKINIEKLMRKPLYVPKSMRVDSLMELLQRNKQHLNIVSMNMVVHQG